MNPRHQNLSRRALHRVVPLIAAIGIVGTSFVVGSTPATAVPKPTLRVSSTTLDGGKAHQITVTGRSYLVPPHAAGAQVFGGVYLFFGWVEPGGNWGPSHRSAGSDNGNFGVSYAYPGAAGDGGTRDTGGGVIRLISFTDGGTSGAATASHMDADGNWTANLDVPGATFSYTTDAGAKRTVDCRVVTCGAFTIGAHGKVSATNEVFAPIRFRTAAVAPKPVPTPKATLAPKPSSTPRASSPVTPQTGSAITSAAPSATSTAGTRPTTTASAAVVAPVSPGSVASPPSSATGRPAPSATDDAVNVTLAASEEPATSTGWLIAALVGLLVVAAGAVAGLSRLRRSRAGQSSS